MMWRGRGCLEDTHVESNWAGDRPRRRDGRGGGGGRFGRGRERRLVRGSLGNDSQNILRGNLPGDVGRAVTGSAVTGDRRNGRDAWRRGGPTFGARAGSSDCAWRRREKCRGSGSKRLGGSRQWIYSLRAMNSGFGRRHGHRSGGRGRGAHAGHERSCVEGRCCQAAWAKGQAWAWWNPGRPVKMVDGRAELAWRRTTRGQHGRSWLGAAQRNGAACARAWHAGR